MLTAEDKVLLAEKGISEEQIAAQLQTFEKGFPFLRLKAAASVGNGILSPSEEARKQYVAAWDAYKQSGKKICKFVPASGAASRMFKNMFEFLDAPYDVPATDFEKAFFAGIHKFAFFEAWDAACVKNNGCGVDALVAAGYYKEVAACMLQPKGLNYGQLPKGLLLFHKYAEGARTPLEEHLVEAALYASSKGEAEVHFTVSAEHEALFKALVEEKLPVYEKAYGVKLHVTFSVQKPSTDTLAATMENEPFRVDGKLLFRPGGHGALIENLNDLQADVLFVKNIDNVVPDRLKEETVVYKQVLAGILVTLQQKAFAYLEKLESGDYGHADLEEIIRFVQQDLCCRKEDVKDLEDADLVLYLRRL